MPVLPFKRFALKRCLFCCSCHPDSVLRLVGLGSVLWGFWGIVLLILFPNEPRVFVPHLFLSFYYVISGSILILSLICCPYVRFSYPWLMLLSIPLIAVATLMTLLNIGENNLVVKVYSTLQVCHVLFSLYMMMLATGNIEDNRYAPWCYLWVISNKIRKSKKKGKTH